MDIMDRPRKVFIFLKFFSLSGGLSICLWCQERWNRATLHFLWMPVFTWMVPKSQERWWVVHRLYTIRLSVPSSNGRSPIFHVLFIMYNEYQFGCPIIVRFFRTVQVAKRSWGRSFLAQWLQARRPAVLGESNVRAKVRQLMGSTLPFQKDFC